jgi:hypothetical protein
MPSKRRSKRISARVWKNRCSRIFLVCHPEPLVSAARLRHKSGLSFGAACSRAPRGESVRNLQLRRNVVLAGTALEYVRENYL